MGYIGVITHLLTIDPNLLGHPSSWFFLDGIYHQLPTNDDEICNQLPTNDLGDNLVDSTCPKRKGQVGSSSLIKSWEKLREIDETFEKTEWKKGAGCQKSWPIIIFTLPETNIFAKNGWLEYDPYLLGFGLFSGRVSHGSILQPQPARQINKSTSGDSSWPKKRTPLGSRLLGT